MSEIRRVVRIQAAARPTLRGWGGRAMGGQRVGKGRSMGRQSSEDPAEQVAKRNFSPAGIGDDHGIEQPFSKGRSRSKGQPLGKSSQLPGQDTRNLFTRR